MNAKLKPFVENISEATTACLLTMLQGNLLAITLGHWLIAAETGIAAGTVTATLVLFFRAQKLWVISLGLGTITCLVDYLVHPGMFGSMVTEAIVTGIGAAVLSHIVGTTLKAMRTLKRKESGPAD